MKINISRIKIAMVEKCLNYSALAEQIGMTRQGINRVMSRGSCSVTTAGRMAKALDIPPEEIINLEE